MFSGTPFAGRLLTQLRDKPQGRRPHLGAAGRCGGSKKAITPSAQGREALFLIRGHRFNGSVLARAQPPGLQLSFASGAAFHSPPSRPAGGQGCRHPLEIKGLAVARFGRQWQQPATWGRKGPAQQLSGRGRRAHAQEQPPHPTANAGPGRRRSFRRPLKIAAARAVRPSQIHQLGPALGGPQGSEAAPVAGAQRSAMAKFSNQDRPWSWRRRDGVAGDISSTSISDEARPDHLNRGQTVEGFET